ncbi:iron chaperone [Ideonella livida]|uniref:YdhG-like domain-containing protein n=1 Tax=Ideonella livida TaxID=2707176 RepID=A0A7C9PKQ8_9BURK|nr:DUF1801 domain-containing protein [Ideonella livida]NDY93831.1 hypothetical protein [Ideonella livida]
MAPPDAGPHTNVADAAAVAAYIAALPPPAQAALQAVRQVALTAAPQATERLSYGMPTLFDHGVVVHIGAFKRHIGLFPPVDDAALRAELAPWAGPKGNLQFQLDQPLPLALIARVVTARLQANRGRAG